MAEVRPFKGLLYNPQKIGGEFSNVCAPPYDVITEKYRDYLYDKSANNIVKLILGKSFDTDNDKENRYVRAARLLSEWIDESILVRDSSEAFYVYLQEYEFKNAMHRRIGFIGLMKISDNNGKEILPHERTFENHKKDRMLLLSEVKANLSPIFTLFSDGDKKVTSILNGLISSEGPIIDVASNGERHKLWRLTDGPTIERISLIMKDKKLFIADGHHRYEVATAYRNKFRTEDSDPSGADHVMMYFADMDSPENLTIMAAHRVVKGIKIDGDNDLVNKTGKYFTFNFFPDIDALLSCMDKAHSSRHVFGYYGRGKYICLELKDNVNIDELMAAPSALSWSEGKSIDWKTLDVAILHHVILEGLLGYGPGRENIIYEKDHDKAVSLVSEGGFDSVFFLNPTRVSQIKAVAERGEVMPEKSTFFYPKLLTGLVINKF